MAPTNSYRVPLIIGLLALAGCGTPPSIYTPQVAAMPNGPQAFAADLASCKSYERSSRLGGIFGMVGAGLTVAEASGGNPLATPDDVIDHCMREKGYEVAGR